MFGDVSGTLESVKSAIVDRVTARTAYGEPVTANGVTVIPVARIAFGFGAGGGVGEAGPSGDGGEAGPPPTGGGGGGGGVVQPLGFIEISAGGARWVPLEPSPSEVALRALVIAAVLAPFGGRRGLLSRLLALLLGRVLVGRLFRPNLPPIEGLRFGRFAESPA
ncbi:MAG: hypothetical protein A2148_11650 [Chloroflexi bacterium RBG_16_68_14]|nr:MAG: hypothetical protein A2148_11650 [Chloroflexi bacterium RBG_16_68_14]